MSSSGLSVKVDVFFFALCMVIVSPTLRVVAARFRHKASSALPVFSATTQFNTSISLCGDHLEEKV